MGKEIFYFHPSLFQLGILIFQSIFPGSILWNLNPAFPKFLYIPHSTLN